MILVASRFPDGVSATRYSYE